MENCVPLSSLEPSLQECRDLVRLSLTCSLPNTDTVCMTCTGAIWTGDNSAEWDHLAMSFPMVMSIGIAGLPFAGGELSVTQTLISCKQSLLWYQLMWVGSSRIQTVSSLSGGTKEELSIHSSVHMLMLTQRGGSLGSSMRTLWGTSGGRCDAGTNSSHFSTPCSTSPRWTDHPS